MAPSRIITAFCFGLVLFERAALAQYPATPQVTKDGTAVLLENFARAPLSSRTLTGVIYSPTNPIIFSDQLARINFMHSLTDPSWTDLTGNLTTTNLTFTLTNSPATNAMFYRVSLLP